MLQLFVLSLTSFDLRTLSGNRSKLLTGSVTTPWYRVSYLPTVTLSNFASIPCMTVGLLEH